MTYSLYTGMGVGVEESFFTVSDGVRLKVIEFTPEHAGENDPVIVFVAGWVSMIGGWHDALKEITRRCRTIYIETREKHSAVIPDGAYPAFTVDRMSMDLEEIVNEKVARDVPFCFAGSSLGSTVILDYLSSGRRPSRKAVLISPIGEFDFPLWARLIINYCPHSAYLVIKHIVIWYLNTFRVDSKNEPEQAAKYQGTVSAAEPRRLQANARALAGYRVWDKLASLGSDVVIVGAKTDKLHGIEILEKMIQLAPSASLEMMESNKETHSDKAGRLILRHALA